VCNEITYAFVAMSTSNCVFFDWKGERLEWKDGEAPSDERQSPCDAELNLISGSNSGGSLEVNNDIISTKETFENKKSISK